MRWFSKQAKRSPGESAAAHEARRVQQVRQGDPDALAALYEAHVDGLYAFVYYRLGRDPALAEDAVQETFSKAMGQLERFDPGRGTFQTWLRNLARNVVRRELRAHHRGEELARTWERIDLALAQVFDALDRAPLADEVLAAEETRDLVNLTIAHLPQQYQEVLRHKYVQGESLSELAHRQGVSPEAVKSQLARARRAFREAFLTLSAKLAEVTP